MTSLGKGELSKYQAVSSRKELLLKGTVSLPLGTNSTDKKLKLHKRTLMESEILPSLRFVILYFELCNTAEELKNTQMYVRIYALPSLFSAHLQSITEITSDLPLAQPLS